jgi:hypothetical protein
MSVILLPEVKVVLPKGTYSLKVIGLSAAVVETVDKTNKAGEVYQKSSLKALMGFEVQDKGEFHGVVTRLKMNYSNTDPEQR